MDQTENSQIDGLVQDCSNSSALAMELLQSCTEPLICQHVNNQGIIIVCQALNMGINIIELAVYSNGSTQDCGHCSESAMELPQSYVKPLICTAECRYNPVQFITILVVR